MQRTSSACARERPAWPPWTGMLEKYWFSYEFARARAMRFLCMCNTVEKQLAFKVLYVEIVAEPKVFEGFRHARAHVARMVLVDRDSHIMHFLVNVERGNVDFAFVFFFHESLSNDTTRATCARACRNPSKPLFSQRFQHQRIKKPMVFQRTTLTN